MSGPKAASSGNCLQAIFARLEVCRSIAILEECQENGTLTVTGGELLAMVDSVRGHIRNKGVRRGDRCGLLAENGVRWIAANLAILAEGLICVPLYARQAPAELAAMLADCEPTLLLCGTSELSAAIRDACRVFPRTMLFDEMYVTAVLGPKATVPQVPLKGSDPMTIIYTSGTSGVAKGVVLTVGNVTHMLGCTSSRLDLLMGGRAGQDRVFHYLPFCFAGSWILLQTSLLRGSLLTLNTDLNRLATELRNSAPDYVLNVPALLERMRRAVDDEMSRKGGVVRKIYSNAQRATLCRQASPEVSSTAREGLWLWLANWLVFPEIRKRMLGPGIRALICGSAPLSSETQRYFHMLGAPVLQGYGLTETTALCTLDDPRSVEIGRVGEALDGVEMRLGENQEILVRGPNIFAGYWNRTEETAAVRREGWFHTGDQGEVNSAGNWKVTGRLKNLVILSSGHNVAPEPIEAKLLQQISGAQQVVIVGNGRGFLAALLSGPVSGEAVQTALDAVNLDLPHYKQVRAFHICQEAFSIESGLLTANGKLKRDAITARFRDEIADMYEAHTRVAS
jgi:long-chain acyl-CoA synthetase